MKHQVFGGVLRGHALASDFFSADTIRPTQNLMLRVPTIGV
jgi:hypothetical protein